MQDRSDMQRLWWRRAQLLAVLVVVVLLLTGLTLRINRRFTQLHQGGEAALRPWMNVPYIARTYDVPPDVLYDAVGVAPEARDTRPLAAIAREQHVSIESVLGRAQMAVRSWRARELPPRAPDAPRPTSPPAPLPALPALPAPLGVQP